MKFFKKIKTYFQLSKKEKLLFLASVYYKQPQNVLAKISLIDREFANKLQDYVYGNKGELSYGEFIKKLLIKKQKKED